MDLFKVTFALIIAICMIPIVPFADAQSGESIMQSGSAMTERSMLFRTLF